MGKTHFIYSAGLHWDDMRCGSKKGEGTNALEHVTCRNCLKLTQKDLSKALAKVEIKEERPTGIRCYLTYKETYEYLIREFIEIREFMVIGKPRAKLLKLNFDLMNMRVYLTGIQKILMRKDNKPDDIIELEHEIQKAHECLIRIYEFRRKCFGAKAESEEKLKDMLEDK